MAIPPRITNFLEISEKISKFMLYDKLMNSYALIGIMLVFLPFFLGVSILSLLNIDSWLVFVLLPLGGYLAIKVNDLINKKRNEYNVDTNEWTTYFTVLISTNLSNYLSTTSSGMRKKYRKEALKYAKNFLSCIDERWTIGNIKPIREYVGDSISRFEKNLRYRIIPAIKDGDEEMLKKLDSVMISLKILSHDFSIESIKNTNEQICKELPNREPLKIGYQMRFSMFLKSHNYIRHSFTTSIIVTVCILFAYTLLTYSNITKEYILASSVALFGILLGTYFSRQPRGEKQ